MNDNKLATLSLGWLCSFCGMIHTHENSPDVLYAEYPPADNGAFYGISLSSAVGAVKYLIYTILYAAYKIAHNREFLKKVLDICFSA